LARLIFNGGSSSWKCSVYNVAADALAGDAGDPIARVDLDWCSPADDAIEAIFAGLKKQRVDFAKIEAVGHRIVHGADDFLETTWLDDNAIARLTALEPFAPSHNPLELAAVAAVRKRLPGVRQYAVFDTQFHRTLPPAAYTYPGPYAWLEKKIRKYGFHGTSVAYATERAAELLGCDPRDTQLIVAHLGGGCSVTAIANGKSVDTSMGFTPLDGTMMSTRSGSVDPAIAIYLMREAAKQANPPSLDDFADELDRTLNHESGLAGISGLSGDLRELIAASKDGNTRARFAIELFAYRLAATIGSMLPALPSLDAIVFTGGIGEHDARLRDKVFARLIPYLGNSDRPVRTFVITAREEWFIAREGARLSAGAYPKPAQRR
jgi:acetate kinase